MALLLAAPAVATLSGPARPSDEGIVPFKINVPDAVLRDLKERLARTRFPDELQNVGWDYGTNLAYLQASSSRTGATRSTGARRSARLNQFDQFTTNIDGLDIHFIHQRSKEPNAMPLVLTHGWPGSIVEFNKVIGPLTDPVKYGGRAEDAFDVVAISLPGFGFSDKPRERGYSPEKMADIIAKLMARLGYHALRRAGR